jgi:uncharacterized protein YcbX
MSSVRSLYRYPVKGLRPEILTQAELRPLRGLLGDRSFAFQFLDDSVPPELTQVDAERAPWMSKFHLAVQHDWPALARILPVWNEAGKFLALKVFDQFGGDERQIQHRVDTIAGREALAHFVFDFLKEQQPFLKARHSTVSPLRLIGATDLASRFTDSGGAPLSFALHESVLDLNAQFGIKIDEQRFRLNLILEGAPAWSELSWTEKKIQIGECIIQVKKPIARCPNIDVDQLTGERHSEIFSNMKSVLGHSLMGMRADVVKEGTISINDKWHLID